MDVREDMDVPDASESVNDFSDTSLLMIGDDMSDPRRLSIRDELHKATQTQKIRKIEQFYNHIGRQLPDFVLPDDFELDKTNHLWIDTIDSAGKEVKVQLTKPKSPDQFYAWSTLKSRIGVSTIQKLGLAEPRAALHQQAVASLQKIQTTIPLEEINLQDMSSSALEINTEVKELAESFETTTAIDTIQDPPLSMRELQGLNKALQSIRGDMLLNRAKLTELDAEIDRQKNKIAEADDENLNPDIKETIRKRLADLYTERSARLEALESNRENMRSNFERIRETVHRILNEDTTFAERIKTLFKEQGITLFSILTAIGMTVSTIILAITKATGLSTGGGGGGDGGGGGGGGGPSKTPVRFVKKALQHVAKLIKNLGEKLAAALPGIIGSVCSWVFSTASKVVSWSADHLWSLFLVVLFSLLKIVQP